MLASFIILRVRSELFELFAWCNGDSGKLAVGEGVGSNCITRGNGDSQWTGGSATTLDAECDLHIWSFGRVLEVEFWTTNGYEERSRGHES